MPGVCITCLKALCALPGPAFEATGASAGLSAHLALCSPHRPLLCLVFSGPFSELFPFGLCLVNAADFSSSLLWGSQNEVKPDPAAKQVAVVPSGRPGATAQLPHGTAVFPASEVATTWPWVTVGVPTATAPSSAGSHTPPAPQVSCPGPFAPPGLTSEMATEPGLGLQVHPVILKSCTLVVFNEMQCWCWGILGVGGVPPWCEVPVHGEMWLQPPPGRGQQWLWVIFPL